MAIILTNNTYSGELLAQPFVTPIVVGNEFVEKQLMRVADERAGIINGRIMDNEVILQPYNPVFTESGSNSNLSQFIIEPAAIVVNQTFDPELLRNYWGADQLSEVFMRRNLTAEYAASLIKVTTEKIANSLAFLTAQGDTSSANDQLVFTNGLRKLAEASTLTNKVASPVVLTASNILAELEKLYLKIPTKLRGNAKYSGRLKILVSYNTLDFYRQAIINSTYKGAFYDTSNRLDVLSYKGIEVVNLISMPDNFMAAGVFTTDIDSNFVMGTNTYSDLANIMIDFTGNLNNQIGLRCGFTAGFAIPKPDEMTIYNYQA